MSDTGRQSMTDKATNSMKPDSQKGMVEQTGDMMSGTMDSAAAALQPNNQKSGSQRVSDSMTGTGPGEESMLSKAKNAVGMGSNSNSNNSNNNNSN